MISNKSAKDSKFNVQSDLNRLKKLMTNILSIMDYLVPAYLAVDINLMDGNFIM